MSNSRLVYSTDGGDRRKNEVPAAQQTGPRDGVVRVARETTGRRGKTVTLVRGLPSSDLQAVASDLKRLCGSGGAVKDDIVELQGDHRERVVVRLRAQGHRVKLAGG